MSANRLTIRLTDAEREALERAAGTRPVATYARERLLGPQAGKRKASRRPKQDARLLAQILAMLGQSELPKTMRELAQASATGTLPGDLRLSLKAACLTIEKMRHDLTLALGIKPE